MARGLEIQPCPEYRHQPVGITVKKILFNAYSPCNLKAAAGMYLPLCKGCKVQSVVVTEEI